MKLYLIVGKEACATRLVSRLLESGGCFAGAIADDHADYHLRSWISSGAPGASSLKDHLSNIGEQNLPDKIVYRTHPTPNYHPHISVIVDKFREAGYQIFWVVLIRRPQRWIKTIPNCDPHEIWGAYREIYKQALPEEQILYWDTSLMFLDSERYLEEMSFMTGLSIKPTETIRNADTRWLKK
jgi:hypothetical protein